MKKKWIVLAGVVLALGALVATAAAHRGGKEARGDGAEAFKALREEHRAAVSKILNEVQREKMEALQLKGLHKAHREVVEQLKGLLLPIPLRFQAPTYRGQNQWRIAIRMPE